MIIITGASQNHFIPLFNFITSFLKHYENDELTKLIVYDLGFNQKEWNSLQKRYSKHGNIIFKTFRYDLYPSYFDINVNAGEYAWKPVIIYDTCIEYGGVICWMDAGNIIEQRLDELHGIVKREGVHSPKSSGNITKWTHPSTLAYLHCVEEFLLLTNRNGACICVDYDVSWVKDIVKEYRDFACIKDCIAPEGSSRENHRQDQSVFTILYYKYHLLHSVPKCSLDTVIGDMSTIQIQYREIFAYLTGHYVGYSIHNDDRKIMLKK
jgi:hypothetical protein